MSHRGFTLPTNNQTPMSSTHLAELTKYPFDAIEYSLRDLLSFALTIMMTVITSAVSCGSQKDPYLFFEIGGLNNQAYFFLSMIAVIMFTMSSGVSTSIKETL